MIIDLAPMADVDINSMSPEGRQRLASILDRFKHLRYDADIRIMIREFGHAEVADSHPLHPLRHALSPAYRELNPHPHFDEARTSAEHVASTALAPQVAKAISGRRTLLDLINDISNATDGGSVRDCLLRSKQDNIGNFVRYPSPDHIAPSLQIAERSYLRVSAECPVFAAIMVMLSVFAVHPLTDGNGRVGRVLFNVILQHFSETSAYMPLYDLAYASSGGWLVALREAHLNANIYPLINFIHSSVLLLTASR